MSTTFHTISDSESPACLDLSTKPSGSIDKASHFEATLSLIRLIGDEDSEGHLALSQDLQEVVESSLPPPEPYYKRSAVLSSTDGLARTRSLTFYDRDRTAKDFLQSNRFNKSMPNTHGNRSHTIGALVNRRNSKAVLETGKCFSPTLKNSMPCSMSYRRVQENKQNHLLKSKLRKL